MGEPTIRRESIVEMGWYETPFGGFKSCKVRFDLNRYCLDGALGVTLVSQIFGCCASCSASGPVFEVENGKFINDGRCSEIMITLRPAMLYEFVSSSHEKIGKLKQLHY